MTEKLMLYLMTQLCVNYFEYFIVVTCSLVPWWYGLGFCQIIIVEGNAIGCGRRKLGGQFL